MSNDYDIGNGLILTGTFTTISGTNADPSAVTCRVKDPRGSTVVYTYALGQVTRVSVGVYTVQITPQYSGEYWYRFEGTGAIVAAMDQTFTIDPSQVVPS